MRLTEQDWSDLKPLLRQAMQGDLGASGEQRLRFLVSKADPGATKMNVAELTHEGLFLFGLYSLMQRQGLLGNAGVTA